MRRLISWALFPTVLLVVIGAATVALDRGVGAGSVIGVGALATWLTVVTSERLLPFRREWNSSQGDILTDIAYLPTTIGVSSAVEPIAKAAAVMISVTISNEVGLGLWPDTAPLLLQFVLACVVAELFDYWPHRWLHEVPLLWRFHTIHHSPQRLYWLNATRSHPVEIAFRSLFNFLPLALLGAGEEVLVLIGLSTMVIGLFQHANIDFELGPLAWIFSVGEMHRWHHSEVLDEANHNYGNNFLFWDVVFGTWYRPRDKKAPDTLGIAGLVDYPATWARQLAEPFRRTAN